MSTCKKRLRKCNEMNWMISVPMLYRQPKIFCFRQHLQRRRNESPTSQDDGDGDSGDSTLQATALAAGDTTRDKESWELAS